MCDVSGKNYLRIIVSILLLGSFISLFVFKNYVDSVSRHPHVVLIPTVNYLTAALTTTPPVRSSDNIALPVRKCASVPVTEECFYQTNDIIQPHGFKLINNQPDLCGSSNINLLILVACRVDEFDIRMTLRNTWASISMLPNSSVKVGFLLGQTENKIVQTKVSQEASQYKDILQEDFTDTYFNLTLKTMMALQWASTYCPNAKWVMKSDSDVFVNVAHALSYFRELETANGNGKPIKALVGQVTSDSDPHRNSESKWHAPESIYPMPHYPPFAYGPCYAISGDLTKDLFDMCKKTPFFYLEDVFLGVVLQKLGANIIASNKFFNTLVADNACAFRDIVSSHPVPAGVMKNIWNEMASSTHRCD